MSLFPTLCVDNFYDDADVIRNYALSLDYYPSDGGYPGKRTKPIHELDESFFQDFCIKFMSLYYDFEKTTANWNIGTYFQLIENFSSDKTSPKNTGWVHQDTEAIFAGLIYLTPEIDPSCGTSMFKLKDNLIHDAGDISVRHEFHANGIDNNYDEMIQKHNSQFVETMRFDNYYNRMISFDSSTYHGVNNFYSEKPRLTQVFFVYNLQMNSKAPMERMKNVKR